MHLRPRFRAHAPLGRVILLVTLAALSGCDYPTAVPLIDQRWVFPIDDQSISVVELLPADVVISGGNFQVDIPPATLNQTLGELCPACIPLDGLTELKPAFNLVYDQSTSLPTDVVSVELVSGSISLAIQNSLGFDPISQAPASPGTLTITLYETDMNGRQLAQVVLDGATDVLPVGLTTIPLTLAPGTITSAIFTEVDFDSPLGNSVLIDINAGFDVTMTVGTLVVSSATINVDGVSVNIDETQLNLEDIDPDIVSNIQSGSLILDVQNPFGVAINVVIEIGGPGIMTLQRTLDIGSGPTSSATLSYTGLELQSFLGKPGVFFRGVGTVVSPGFPATVTPTQVAVIEAKLDVVLEIGG